MEIVRDVTSFRDAIQTVGELSPDVVIFLGVSPLRSWKRFAMWLSESRPDIESLWMEGPDYGLAEASEARIPVTIIREGTDLADAIRMVLERGPSWGDSCGQLSTLERPPKAPLTSRQVQILHEVMNGLTTREMAKLFKLDESTIKFHMEKIFEKLGANNRAQAVAIAIRHGLVE
jgi:DNA-binding NarL/FixJ family response regulator